MAASANTVFFNDTQDTNEEYVLTTSAGATTNVVQDQDGVGINGTFDTITASPDLQWADGGNVGIGISDTIDGGSFNLGEAITFPSTGTITTNPVISTIPSLNPGGMSFYNELGQLVVQIALDGNIIYGPGYDGDGVADEFWKRIQMTAPSNPNNKTSLPSISRPNNRRGIKRRKV